MNAVAEHPQNTMQDLMNKPFTGPAAMQGTPVLFWHRGKRGIGTPSIGFVLYSNTRKDPATGQLNVMNRGMLTLHIPMVGRADSVPHADDPRLDINADQRESGCWEHTEHHKWQLELDASVRRLILAATEKRGPGRPRQNQQESEATPPAGSSTGAGDSGAPAPSGPTLDTL